MNSKTDKTLLTLVIISAGGIIATAWIYAGYTIEALRFIGLCFGGIYIGSLLYAIFSAIIPSVKNLILRKIKEGGSNNQPKHKGE